MTRHPAGEDIDAGDPVYIDGDGRLRKSVPAMSAVAGEDIETGQTVYLDPITRQLMRCPHPQEPIGVAHEKLRKGDVVEWDAAKGHMRKAPK